jgi:hypothetical protein
LPKNTSTVIHGRHSRRCPHTSGRSPSIADSDTPRSSGSVPDSAACRQRPPSRWCCGWLWHRRRGAPHRRRGSRRAARTGTGASGATTAVSPAIRRCFPRPGGTRARCRDPASGQPTPLHGHTDSAYAVAFSPDDTGSPAPAPPHSAAVGPGQRPTHHPERPHRLGARGGALARRPPARQRRLGGPRAAVGPGGRPAHRHPGEPHRLGVCGGVLARRPLARRRRRGGASCACGLRKLAVSLEVPGSSRDPGSDGESSYSCPVAMGSSATTWTTQRTRLTSCQSVFRMPVVGI